MTTTDIAITPRENGYYTVDGKRFVSVTTALSVIRDPFLERWRGDVGNEEADMRRDTAAELGSLVHQMIADGREDEPTAYAQVDLMLAAYREWRDLCIDTVIAMEQTVFHRPYQYAGTLDMLAVYKGDTEPSVIDFKTGVLNPVMGLQLAAYAEAVNQHEQTVARRVVLQLGKGERAGKWITRDYSDPADFRRFSYALDLFRWREAAK